MISEISHIDMLVAFDGSASVKREPGFDKLLMNEINNVDIKIKSADQSVVDLATNNNTNVHDVMLSIQDARLSLQLLMKVRDSALESLQDILKMQV